MPMGEKMGDSHAIFDFLGVFLIPVVAYARVVPSPETDLGVASFVMVAGAALLARRLRRR